MNTNDHLPQQDFSNMAISTDAAHALPNITLISPVRTKLICVWLYHFHFLTKDETLFPNQTFPKASLMEDYLEYHLRGIVTRKGEQTLNNFINNGPND